MPIVVTCSHCGQHGEVSRSAVGQSVTCAKCRQAFPVPFGSGQLAVEWGVGVAGTRLPLTPGREVSLGRGLDCDLMLPGPRVSRRHAVIRRTDDEWRIIDQHSANGTFVDGQRITEAALATDRHITIGDYVIRVTVIEQPREDDSRALAGLIGGESVSTETTPVKPPSRPVLPGGEAGGVDSGDTVMAAPPPGGSGEIGSSAGKSRSSGASRSGQAGGAAGAQRPRPAPGSGSGGIAVGAGAARGAANASGDLDASSKGASGARSGAAAPRSGPWLLLAMAAILVLIAAVAAYVMMKR